MMKKQIQLLIALGLVILFPKLGYSVHWLKMPTTASKDSCLKTDMDFRIDTTGVPAGKYVIFREWEIKHATNATNNTDYYGYSARSGDTLLGIVFNLNDSGSLKNSIKIILTLDDGSTISYERTIGIKKSPLLNFGGFDKCYDSTTTFFNNTDTAGIAVSMYRWVIRSATGGVYSSQAYKKLPNGLNLKPDVYDVFLQVRLSSGCADSQFRPMYVFEKPKVNFVSKTAVCNGERVLFEQKTSASIGPQPNTFIWDFDKGTGTTQTSDDTISTVFTTAKVYNVKLTAITPGGCKHDTTIKVTSIASPTVDFDIPKICQYAEATFTNKSSTSVGTLKYKWNLGNGDTSSATNAKTIYNLDGKFAVKLVATSSNGCKDSTTDSVDVIKAIAVKLDITEACFYDSIEIKDITTPSTADPVVKRTWDMGDGSTAFDSGNRIAYYFPKAGQYSVKLVHTTTGGCKSQGIVQVKAYHRPQPKFVTNSVCSNNRMFFTNQSTIDTTLNDKIIAYLWDFGDATNSTTANPNTSNAQDPSHIYIKSGKYKVRLTVISDNGCDSTIENEIDILQSPTTTFTNTLGCENTDIDFTYTGNGNTVRWNFGDTTATNDTSLIKNPTYNYSYGGQINVMLVSYGSNGCRDTLRKVIGVNKKSKVSFDATGACQGATTYFQSTADANESDPPTKSKFRWDFPDGTSIEGASQNQASKDFLTSGTKKVRLTITTNFGCVSFKDSDIVINPKPVANFTHQANRCRELGTVFTNQSSNFVSKWSWDFNNTGFDTVPNPTHTFPANRDSEEVTLIVESNRGCLDTVKKYITYNKSPKAVIDIRPNEETVCLSKPFVAEDLSEEPDGSFTPSRVWYMGDGNTATTKLTNHYYSTFGEYKLRLVAVGANGCTDTSSFVTIEILKPPFAIINHEPQLCANYPAIFYADSSLDAERDAFEWFFDNTGVPIRGNKVSYLFPGAGQYWVKLVAKNNVPADNCSDTDSIMVEIKPTPVLGFTADTVCEGGITKFTNTSTVDAPANISDTKFSWTFGDDFGGVSDSFAPSYLYYTSGVYDVTLNGYIDYGAFRCPAKPPFSNKVAVRPNPVAKFSFDPGPNIDNTLPVAQVIDESSLDVIDWIWDYGDSSGDFGQVPDTHRYPVYPYDTGTFVVTLYVTNSFGCKDTTQQILKVKQFLKPYIPNAFTPNGDDQNDFWKPSMLGVRTYRCIIYNRWGEVVYQSYKYQDDKGWDGTVKGKKSPDGVYIYSIEATDYDNLELRKFKGSLHLLR